jgi:hypothetical protein
LFFLVLLFSVPFGELHVFLCCYSSLSFCFQLPRAFEFPHYHFASSFYGWCLFYFSSLLVSFRFDSVFRGLFLVELLVLFGCHCFLGLQILSWIICPVICESSFCDFCSVAFIVWPLSC